MTQDEKIMQILIEYSYTQIFNNNAYPFCAFIVKDGVIVSKGYNRSDNPYMKKTDHGEMVAIRNACQALQQFTSLKGYTLYTTCEPCLACLDTSIWLEISKIVYSIGKKDFAHYFNDHPYGVMDYVKDRPGKLQVNADVLHEEGFYLFRTAQRKYAW